MRSKLNKEILNLAVPNILSNLSVPLLSSVDTALVGHLPEPYFIGAVAIGTMIFNFLYWGFGFLRMGTTGLTAQAYGADNNPEIIRVLGRALLVAAAGSVLMIVLQWPIVSFSFFLIEASGDVEYFARSYFYIRIFAAPATLGLYAMQGWFLGMQNARYPMILIITTNLLNIGFTVFFIKVLGMKSDGVALGTVCAQYSGLVLALVLFHRKYWGYLKSLKWAHLFYVDALKRFFMLNGDIFIRTLLLIFAFSLFTAKSAEFGDDILAANSILLQLWMVFSYGIDGFAFAAESMVGKYIGARSYPTLKVAIRLIFVWGTGLGAAFSVVYGLFDETIIRIYTGQENVVRLALTFMTWTIAAPVINSICYVWDGVFIGATASKAMRNAMLISTLVFYIPLIYLGMNLLGNHGMWLALLIFMFMRGLTLTLMAKNHIFNFAES
ncbi:MAG: MATE family efflux transporter [Caldithrix sp.]|nr:MATE family efflux transporter [Caldithrix sp.]